MVVACAASKPLRARKAEVLLDQGAAPKEVVDQAIRELPLISFVRGSVEFKKQVISTYMTKALVDFKDSFVKIRKIGWNPHSFITKRVNRPDALPKVTGQARYTVDLVLPGMLVGKILRSPRHHARILHLDPTPALKVPGVKAVITSQDLPSMQWDSGDPCNHILPHPVHGFPLQLVYSVRE